MPKEHAVAKRTAQQAIVKVQDMVTDTIVVGLQEEFERRVAQMAANKLRTMGDNFHATSAETEAMKQKHISQLAAIQQQLQD
eukprot:SAG31_NODE_25300_length_464_cov_0.736986_1_plen_81_part_10